MLTDFGVRRSPPLLFFLFSPDLEKHQTESGGDRRTPRSDRERDAIDPPRTAAIEYLRRRDCCPGVAPQLRAAPGRPIAARTGKADLRPEAEGAALPAAGDSDDLAVHAGRPQPRRPARPQTAARQVRR